MAARAGKARTPTLAIGSSDISNDSGFSLVELLAVLAIMSLMVGAVLAGRPDGPTRTDRDTARMAAQLQRFFDDAALAGEIRALGASTDGLSLYAHDGVQWVERAALPWPEDARVELRDGDVRVKLTEDATPAYRFEPYGDVPELVVSMRGPDATYVLSPDARGRFTREVER